MKKIIILLLSLILITACSKPYSTDEQPNEADIPSDDTPVAEIEVIPETSEESEVAYVNILADLRCVDGKISGIITNTEDTLVTIGKEIKIMVNGLLVPTPECDSLAIEPGKFTSCTDISGHYAIRAGKVNTVKLNLLNKAVQEEVLCPE